MALRLISDREEEINAFIPEEYWNLEAVLKQEGSKKSLTAKFYGDKDGKIAIGKKEELDKILKGLENQTYQVEEVKNGERVKKKLPYHLLPVPSSRKHQRYLIFQPRRPCVLPSSCMKAWRLQGMEPWDLSPI